MKINSSLNGDAAMKNNWSLTPLAIVVALVLFGLWAGIPAFNKWRAEKLVDELCAADGGVRVYEAIELPPSQIPKNWAAIPFERIRKPNDEFYFVGSKKDIRGNSSSTDIAALSVYRMEIALFRAADKKLLGVTVTYSRRGGDAIGPWHPSVYSCPPHSTESDLVREVLIVKKR